MKPNVAALLAVAMLAVSPNARALQAYIATGSALLAGPAAEYPPVLDLSSGEPVEVVGCVDGYSWCDVSFQGYRGWFDGRQLVYPYGGVRVPLTGFGAQIGVPVVGFAVEDYWGRFYRDRPFYRDRARWAAGQGPGPQRTHGPVHGTADRGPHLPPTPTLQPRVRPDHRDDGQVNNQPR
jgi:uncharacterized protein YraI